jgi:hypothetical protein
MLLRSKKSCYQLQKLAATLQPREWPSPFPQLVTHVLENEGGLEVTNQWLLEALTAGKPVPTGQTVLSSAQHAARRDLLNARHARQYADSGGRKGKAKGTTKWTKAPKANARKRSVVEHTMRADDSEVERQVEELLRMEEEEAEEERPKADFGIDEDDIPEAESSAAATRREPARRCKRG